MTWVSDVWDCECCGSMFDKDLTVEVDGNIIGTYSEDGHFGDSRIDHAQGGVDIARAVGAEDAYAVLCAQRIERKRVLTVALEAAATRAEEELVYGDYAEGGRDFEAWLASLGYVLCVDDDDPYVDADGDGTSLAVKAYADS